MERLFQNAPWRNRELFRLDGYAKTGPDRPCRRVCKPGDLVLGGLDQREPLGEQVVAEVGHVDVAESIADFTKQARGRDPVMKAEQRPAVAALDIDQAIEEDMPERRKHLAHRAPEQRS